MNRSARARLASVTAAVGLLVTVMSGAGPATASAVTPSWTSGVNAAGESLTFTAQPGDATLVFTRSVRFSCSLPSDVWPLFTFTGLLARGADGIYTGSGLVVTSVYTGTWSTSGAAFGPFGDSFSLPMTFAPVPGVPCANGAPQGFTTFLTRVAQPIPPPTYPRFDDPPQPAPTPRVPRCFARESQTLAAGGTLTLTLRCTGGGRSGPRIEIVTPPTHGRLAKGSYSGSWTYRPAKGYVGEDRFTYRATNDVGASPDQEVRIRVRRPTAAETAAAYTEEVCSAAPSNTSCRAGRNRRTAGGEGTGKVSHRNWPAISGVYLSVYAGGSGKLRGGERNDELLGHHGSDQAFGGEGKDVLWGDWDPDNNNGRQVDLLDGGDGTDFIYTSHGRNTVRGGSGDDFIWAFYGHGTIDCGPGNDKVRLSGRASAYKLRSCERRGTF